MNSEDHTGEGHTPLEIFSSVLHGNETPSRISPFGWEEQLPAGQQVLWETPSCRIRVRGQFAQQTVAFLETQEETPIFI